MFKKYQSPNNVKELILHTTQPHFYKDVKYTFYELNQTFKDLVSPIMDDLNNLTYDLSVRLKPVLPYMFEEEGDVQPPPET